MQRQPASVPRCAEGFWRRISITASAVSERKAAVPAPSGNTRLNLAGMRGAIRFSPSEPDPFARKPVFVLRKLGRQGCWRRLIYTAHWLLTRDSVTKIATSTLWIRIIGDQAPGSAPVGISARYGTRLAACNCRLLKDSRLLPGAERVLSAPRVSLEIRHINTHRMCAREYRQRHFLGWSKEMPAIGDTMPPRRR